MSVIQSPGPAEVQSHLCSIMKFQAGLSYISFSGPPKKRKRKRKSKEILINITEKFISYTIDFLKS